MNKKPLLVLASMLLVTSLAGCGGNGNNKKNTPTAEEVMASIAQNEEANIQTIKSGTFMYNNTMYGSSTTNGTFEYGTNDNGLMYDYILNIVDDYGDEGVYNTYSAYYAFHDTDGSVLSYSYMGETKDTAQFNLAYLEESSFEGVDFTYMMFNPDYNTMHGGYGVVDTYFAYAKENNNKDIAYTVEDGTLNFTTGYTYQNWDYSDAYAYVDATFTYDTETYFVTGFSVRMYSLESSEVTVDDEEGTFSYENVDFSQKTALYTAAYTAVSGTREHLDFEYESFDSFYFTSFSLACDGVPFEDGDVVNCEIGDDYCVECITIASYAPETADPAMESFTLTVSQDGVECAGYNFYSDYQECFYFGSMTEPGIYDVTVTSKKGASVSFTANVSAASLKSLEFDSYYYDSEWESWDYTGTENVYTNLYVGNTYYYGIDANPSSADASCTLAADSDNVTIEEMTVESWGDEVKVFAVTVNAAGIYNLTATSTVDETISATLNITVSEAPNVSSMIAGHTYVYFNQRGAYASNYYAFSEATETTEDGYKGTLKIQDYSKTEITTSDVTYEFNVSEKTITTNISSGNNRDFGSMEFYIDDNYDLYVTVTYYGEDVDTYPETFKLMTLEHYQELVENAD